MLTFSPAKRPAPALTPRLPTASFSRAVMSQLLAMLAQLARR
jgi:hypothetical protein